MFSNPKGKKPGDPEGIRIYDLVPSEFTKTKHTYGNFYRSLVNGNDFGIYSKIKKNVPYITSIKYFGIDGNKDPIFIINNSFKVVFVSGQTPKLLNSGGQRRKQTKKVKSRKQSRKQKRKRKQNQQTKKRKPSH